MVQKLAEGRLTSSETIPVVLVILGLMTLPRTCRQQSQDNDWLCSAARPVEGRLAVSCTPLQRTVRTQVATEVFQLADEGAFIGGTAATMFAITLIVSTLLQHLKHSAPYYPSTTSLYSCILEMQLLFYSTSTLSMLIQCVYCRGWQSDLCSCG